MQKNSMSELKRILIDGEEIPGLVNIGDVELTKGELEAPEYKKIRRLSNGVTTIPAIEATYKLNRNSSAISFFQDWYDNDEVHDVTVIRADGHGVEFDRDIWPKCELTRLMKPAYDASDPAYAQVQITIVPWDIINVEAG
ncbi:MAG: hypothetical protein GF388_05980 [Candidatus Aegiribacteria sp.]|nr:hypothetical protein [Candidatus Aegiribacteria sp.]